MPMTKAQRRAYKAFLAKRRPQLRNYGQMKGNKPNLVDWLWSLVKRKG